MAWLLEAAANGVPAAPPAHEPPGSSPSRSPPLPLLLSSPYLNPPAEYVERLLLPRAPSPHATAGGPPLAPMLLSAAPSASSFWGAGGLKGLIPHVYAGLEESLRAAAHRCDAPITVLHYARPGWTYHAKGLWLWPPQGRPAAAETSSVSTEEETAAIGMVAAREASDGDSSEHPLLSVLGSSNLSERSTRRDVELSACLVATDVGVRRQLHEEQARLREHARAAPETSTDGRAAAAAVARALATFIRRFF